MDEELYITDGILDLPSDSDTLFSDIVEGLDNGWIRIVNGIYYNQNLDKKTYTACWAYWAYGASNNMNKREYQEWWEVYKEIDPKEPRFEFCEKRGYYDKGSTLQTRLKKLTDTSLISGYAVVKTKEDIMTAIDSKWSQVYTWVNVWRDDRMNARKTWILTFTWRWIWHCIFFRDFNDDWVICKNSRWEKRGVMWWDFIIKREDIGKTFTKYALFDYKDQTLFDKLRIQRKINEWIKTAQDIWKLTIDQQLKNDMHDVAEIYRKHIEK